MHHDLRQPHSAPRTTVEGARSSAARARGVNANGGRRQASRNRVRCALVAGLLAVLVSCSGGSGSGPAGAAPVIVTAAFIGSGAAPAADDALVLAFSRDIAIIAGALLTDDDVALSGGATLGDVTQPPTLLSPNTISVTLGAGVQLTPGVTTVALAIGNDVVGGPATAPTDGGDPVTIGTSDGAPPTLVNVTIAAIDGELNGTGPAGGTLQVPPNGWTLDLAYTDNSGVATAATVITADVAVGTSTGTQPAGTNLRPFLDTLSATSAAARYSVPSTTTFPAGPFTLTLFVVDVSGLASTPVTFAATARQFSDFLRPFETNVNPSQVWFVDFSRDLESFATAPAGGGFQVQVLAGGNGRTDFEDLLRVIGLNSASPIPNVEPGQDSNQVAVARLQQNLLQDLATFYSGANVSFTLTQPAGSFNGSTSVPYGALGYSSIAVGGAATSTGVLGLAIFDPSNTTQNDNTNDDFSGQRLGVFVHTIIDAGMRSPSSTQFRLTFDPFAPDFGGIPIGDAPDDLDDERLRGEVSDPRATQLEAALDGLAQFIATVVAHECGHSVGLVENGPMPVGLYGNDSGNFPGSSDGHIRNISLFPAASINVMSPALSYTTATNPATAFNTLNLAYLREQVFYGN